jgi:hypothetical protein
MVLGGREKELNKRLFAAFAGCMVLFVACASTPANAPPEWVRRVETVYPRAKYIAQQAQGKTQNDAEMKAVTAISLFFETELNTSQSRRSSWTEQDGVSSSESRTEEMILVESQISLMAVRYAEDPWRDPASKEWYTVAYIDREEAWPVYEPQAKKAADTLLALYNAAEAEEEPFTRALRIGAAASYAESAAFIAARSFAQVLDSSKAQALFSEADAAISALPEKNYSARQSATVYIDCPIDLDGMIYQAMVSALGTAGFPVERDRNAAVCICRITVDEGEQKASSGTFFYPALAGTVNGKNGAVFSFNVNAERQGAINPDLAKRRAYTALATALRESFSAELMGNTGASP